SLALDSSTPLTGRASVTTDTGTGTINDNDTATFQVNDATATEGGDLVFTVSLSNPIDTTAVVNVSFTNVTTSGRDFDHTTQQVTFPANSTASQTVTVAINDDMAVEGTETFTAHLALDGTTPLTGGYLKNLADIGTGTITDNDTAGARIFN